MILVFVILVGFSITNNIINLHAFLRRGRRSHGNTVAGQCSGHMGWLGRNGRHGEVLSQPERFIETADANFGGRQGAE